MTRKWAGARVLVVGMKKSGMASVELLARLGADVRATDLKPLAALGEAGTVLARLNIPFELQTPAVFLGCDAVVISPDVPADLAPLEAARAREVDVIGEVELAAPFLKGKTIGVTGTNGKTTTTSLIGHILRQAGTPVQVGGNIGTPATAMLDSSREDAWNVLELSSFQLETIRDFCADIGLALNVTQNHLDRHHTFENYAAAKAHLFRNMTATGFAILNADDPVAAGYASQTEATVEWFSGKHPVDRGAHLCGEKLLLDGELLMNAGEIPLRGRHNVENVLAASIAAARAGVGSGDIAAAVRTFRAVEHRLEFVRALNGIDFYNDSKATSVDAALKALDAFGGGLWVILGGKDKGLDFSPLREPLRQKAHAALLIGSAAPKLAVELRGALPLIESGTLDAAVRYGYRKARAGDTVLLAPACACFDQFRSFEHRGDVFKELVSHLDGGNGHGTTP